MTRFGSLHCPENQYDGLEYRVVVDGSTVWLTQDGKCVYRACIATDVIQFYSNPVECWLSQDHEVRLTFKVRRKEDAIKTFKSVVERLYEKD